MEKWNKEAWDDFTLEIAWVRLSDVLKKDLAEMVGLYPIPKEAAFAKAYRKLPPKAQGTVRAYFRAFPNPESHRPYRAGNVVNIAGLLIFNRVYGLH